jgi:hypothetical protein
LVADVPPNAGKAESPNLQSFVKQQFSGTPPDQQKGNITLFNYVFLKVKAGALPLN